MPSVRSARARDALQAWNIRSCVDFGTIVLRMAELGAIQLNAAESIADFQNLFSFDDAFTNLAKESPGRGFVYVSMAE